MSTNATPDKFQVIMQLMPSATSPSFHCKGDTGIYAWRFVSTAFSNQAWPKSRHMDGHPSRNEPCLKNNLADLSMKRLKVVTITQCSHNVRCSKMASQQWKIGLFKPGKENWFIRKWNHIFLCTICDLFYKKCENESRPFQRLFFKQFAMFSCFGSGSWVT